VLVHAVLLSGRSVVDASRGLPRAKASYWRTAFRFALDEIGAIVGLTTDRPKRPPVPERYALQATVMVATVRKGAP
jgi:hypothetical protein